MRKQLTEAMIEKLRPPPGGRMEIFDAIVPGLAVRLTPNGAKSFVVRGRVKGWHAPIRITLGDARGMKLSAARQEASDVLRALRAGTDPREVRRLRKLEAEKAGSLRFEHVVETFIGKHAKRNRSWRQNEALFANHVTPHWRGRLLTEITRADMVALLDKIEDHTSIYQANRVLAAVRKLYNWAILRGLVSSSPIVAGMAREGERARTRYLDFDEIRLVWPAAGRLGHPFGPLFKFLLVTGQRRSEAAGARWSSIHDRMWTLTPEETKAEREHLVPLSDLAQEILAALPRISDPASKQAVYVFTTIGSAPVSGFGRAKAKLEEFIREQVDAQSLKPIASWRLHDLRRTVATHMEDALGIPPHIVGSVLNHAPSGYKGVTSVYTRGDLIFERRRALTAWARLLRLVIDGGAPWKAVAKVLRPETEVEAARTAEFRRVIQGDEAAWSQYVRKVAA